MEPPQCTPQENMQALGTDKFPCNSGNEYNTKGQTNIKIDHSHPSHAADYENLLHPYTSVMVWRKLPKATYIGGRLVTRYKAPKVTEYLDMRTGEIIQAACLRNDRRVPQEIHVGEIQMLRKCLMDSMRKEVREFAMFVVQFRNSRRGVTPEIEVLVNWYSRIHRKRPSNVKRYVETLREKSFFAGESLLSPLFQRTGKKLTSKDHLGEDAAARSILLKIRLKAISRLNLDVLLDGK